MTSSCRIGAAALCAALVCCVGFAQPARAADGFRQMSGPDAQKALQAGMPLHFREITGPVQLTKIVKGGLICTPCIFDQDLTAQNVTFNGSVDLRGVVANGTVDMSGSTFSGRSLFGILQYVQQRGKPCETGDQTSLCEVHTAFRGPVDFSLATFRQPVGFDGVVVKQKADFSLVRFQDEADFSGAIFGKDTIFDGSRFAKPVTFLGADFIKHLDFDYVASPSTVDFEMVEFDCTLPEKECTTANESRDKNPDADFGYTSLAGISFAHAKLATGVQLWMVGLAATSFVLSPSAIHHVSPADRDRVLGMVESTAKTAGNLGVANDADYRLHVLRSDDYHQPWRFLDFVFYRSMAGYLVEPLQPLLTLLALALVVSLIRLVLPRKRCAKLWLRTRIAWENRRRPRPKPASSGGKTRPSPGTLVAAAPAATSSYFHQLLDTLSLMWPWSGAAVAGRRLEANLYRLLFVCFLIGLANSNPTLRQMLDAFH